MNRLITLLSAILLTVCARAQIDVFTALDLEKGEPCDTARYLVYYNMKCVTDTSSSSRTFVDDIMRLELGDRVHCFYSYKGYQADSICSPAEAMSRGDYTRIILPLARLRSWRSSARIVSCAWKTMLHPPGHPCPTARRSSSATRALLPWPRIRDVHGMPGTPRTFRLMPVRGSSVACQDSYCGLMTLEGITSLTLRAWKRPCRGPLYIIKV